MDEIAVKNLKGKDGGRPHATPNVRSHPKKTISPLKSWRKSSSIYSRIKRITCDIDSKDIQKVIKCLKVFKKYGFNKNITVKPSPSGKGYHVVAWSNKGETLDKLIKIRMKAGDDHIRCTLDAIGDRAIQVLFTHKEKRMLGKDAGSHL